MRHRQTAAEDPSRVRGPARGRPPKPEGGAHQGWSDRRRFIGYIIDVSDSFRLDDHTAATPSEDWLLIRVYLLSATRGSRPYDQLAGRDEARRTPSGIDPGRSVGCGYYLQPFPLTSFDFYSVLSAPFRLSDRRSIKRFWRWTPTLPEGLAW